MDNYGQFTKTASLCLILFLVTTVFCYSQIETNESSQIDQEANEEILDNPPPEEAGKVYLSEVSWLSGREFWLSLAIMVFGLSVIIIEFILMRNRDMNTGDILKVFAVTLILIGSLLLITGGFSADDIGPSLGLFGTIAGYLLGRGTTEERGKAT